MDSPRVSESRQQVARSKEIRLLCPHCHSAVFVSLDWPFAPVERQRRISEAINEHRKNCAGAPPEAQRVYRIDYPRV